jgi:hypothetical protein
MPLPWLSLGLGLTLLALVACAPQRVTVVPEALQDLSPLSVWGDPHLFALMERWVSGGTAGEVAVRELLPQVLVDDLQAPLRLTHVTSLLHVATVVSPVFDRPHAYEARDQLIVHVTAPATGERRAWLHAAGESRTLVSTARREAGGPRDGLGAQLRKASRAAMCPGISCGPRSG